MLVKDTIIMTEIERIGEHFRANISNRFLRPILLQLSLDKYVWTLLEHLTEKHEHYQYQGSHFDDLYRQTLAGARFVAAARRDLLPNLRYRFDNSSSEGQEKILRDMAVHNFASNLKVFADMLKELYDKLVLLDQKAARNKRPFYLSIPELKGIDQLLEG